MCGLKNKWVQFDCPDCLVLEFEYQAFCISENDEKFNQVKLIKGTVNFESFELESMHGTKENIKVRRTSDNLKKRPNGDKRHDPFKNVDQGN